MRHHAPTPGSPVARPILRRQPGSWYSEEDRSRRTQARAWTMSSINANDAAQQVARSWSERLGSLAAQLRQTRPTTVVLQPGDVTGYGAVSRGLSAILPLGQHNPAQEHAADKLKVQEFLVGT